MAEISFDLFSYSCFVVSTTINTVKIALAESCYCRHNDLTPINVVKTAAANFNFSDSCHNY